MLDAKIVGKVIQHYRKAKGLSQEVLSGLANICRTHLSSIERGGRKPTLETLYRISLALDVSASELMKDIEQEMKNLSSDRP
ncbi:MAG: helix-turn-helix domain-containing protein [Oscillospiraceae bacterium]|nr:helix-turn-helix domain-containing protein [Oscillospiraceae bacterium]